MNTIETYSAVCMKCSREVTKHYSTSFSWAIKLLHKDLQQQIHAIYGFVRLADEIVDTFHQYDKEKLLNVFRSDVYAAIHNKVSLNPVLQSFQLTIHQYNIPLQLVDDFLESMEMDLDKKVYHTHEELDSYIYGSAEVVGLMCLMVFCEGNEALYNDLAPAAQQLGAAFQKINFLRDLEDDQSHLQRSYFPGVDLRNFDEQVKQTVENGIATDFEAAMKGILKLPIKARFGVYVAYRYYFSLFKRIRKQRAASILQQRIRIPNVQKLAIILDAGIRSKMGAW